MIGGDLKTIIITTDQEMSPEIETEREDNTETRDKDNADID